MRWPSRVDAAALREAGFTGFVAVADLWRDGLAQAPAVPGVYLIVRDSDAGPKFVERGSAGWFKGRDPNVPVAELCDSWVDGTPVLYIGKAGKLGGRATLRSRLRQYLRMGHGHRAAHWGGRSIWQLADAQELKVCWKPTPGVEPRAVERAMVEAFVHEFGKRPIANLAR